jgi:hypothetical protein
VAPATYIPPAVRVIFLKAAYLSGSKLQSFLQSLQISRTLLYKYTKIKPITTIIKSIPPILVSKPNVHLLTPVTPGSADFTGFQTSSRKRADLRVSDYSRRRADVKRNRINA